LTPRQPLQNLQRFSEHDILKHAGRVSHEAAVAKAEGEYDRFAAQQRELPSAGEQHFELAISELKQIEGKRPRPKGKPKK